MGTSPVLTQRKYIRERPRPLPYIFGIYFTICYNATLTVKGEFAGVVELVTGSTGQEAVNNLQVLDLLILLQHLVMGGQQTIVKSLNHGHRQNNQAIFVGFERANEGVGHIPDNR